MGEFEDMLNSILSSPKEMEKIMGIAREISGEQAAQTEPDTSDAGLPDARTLAALGKLIGEFKNQKDDKAALVASMKPYLRPQRREALDRAVKIARIARVAKIAISEFGGDLDLGL